jgi:HD-GYP domain-containing protein (c-di-GMP phosphodiesterase class II)
VLSKIMRDVPPDLDLEGLLEIAVLCSHVIDFKSAFTSTHSAGVAASSQALAHCAGFSGLECRQMLIAGYLHDLGKVAVPSEVLDKPAGLTADEYGVIRSHTYYTRRILEGIPGLGVITDWAASHHERLDGAGYPYHTADGEISLGARLLAVADVFTALTEDRPYRNGMPGQHALEVLTRMAEEGRLDPGAVSLLGGNYENVNSARREAQEQAAAEYKETLAALAAGRTE